MDGDQISSPFGPRCSSAESNDVMFTSVSALSGLLADSVGLLVEIPSTLI